MGFEIVRMINIIPVKNNRFVGNSVQLRASGDTKQNFECREMA